MKKRFNTTGPCWPNDHYMLPTQERCQGLMELIEEKQYFVIHAARQTGKSTLLLELVEAMNEVGDYYVLYCSLESAYGIVEPEKGIPAVMRALREQVSFDPVLSRFSFAETVNFDDYNIAVRSAFTHFCRTLDKPLVVLFDEVDCLFNGTLISFLRQLREGYINRGRIPFIHAVALVGMRNIRDYKVRPDRETLGTASPFNIVAEARTIRNFYRDEIVRLYAQHTAQTEQLFPADVADAVHHYTHGQPWLVNAIAREIVEKMLGRDDSRPITVDHVDHAANILIKRRDTHIDSLMERLKEERVQRIVEPVILGETPELLSMDDDYQYVLDLGLLRREDKRLVPANPMYGEVMVRVLSRPAQETMESEQYPPTAPAYLEAETGRLNMRRLLGDFQQFWRENSEMWRKRYQYQEAAPHLVLQAFLQRVINAGGTMTREMAAGSRRLDLCVHFQGHRYPLELKVRRNEKVYEQGKTQLHGYLETLGENEGWLIVFDQRATVSWDDKVFWRIDEVDSKVLHTVGC